MRDGNAILFKEIFPTIVSLSAYYIKRFIYKSNLWLVVHLHLFSSSAILLALFIEAFLDKIVINAYLKNQLYK